ncbi:MAG: hypothetical protein KDA86_09925 [Planctomycetaceae bacterium]|nr:hypothetical protein [Planctomycetaceae bacterium]
MPQPLRQPTEPQIAMIEEQPEDRWQPGDFVGSQKCAECHSEIAETFSEHPMANTLAAIADDSQIEVVEGDASEFEAHGCKHRVERDGDRMIHAEFMTDSEGKLVYEQSEEVHYAVGSGRNAKTYLIDRGGIMFESPITWWVGKHQWDLSPGYQDNPRERFNRRVSDGCVQCHSGRVAPAGDGTSNHFEEPPFPELGIGCERCHGPGRRHVEKMEADDGDTDVESAEELLIVNPAQLDGHLAESICYQCHNEGKRRILRKGKSYHDFQPGMATEDVWTVFVSSTPIEADGTTPFTSQAEQMHSSACFRGSKERMSCTSCHDPHRAPDPDERAAFYRERCNDCHSDHGCSLPIAERELPPAFNSCIHCHMPSSGSSDIPHASHSDHRVLRNPHNGPDVVETSNAGKVWSIFDESEQRLPEWEVQRARALALCEQALEDRDQRLFDQAVAALDAVLARDPNDVNVLRSLGGLCSYAGKDAQAAMLFEAGLQADPHDELSLLNLGLMASRIGSFRKGLRSYEAYLKLNPWDATVFAPYVVMLAKSGDLPAAVEAAERGLRLDPTDRELRRIAVQLYASIGDQQTSVQHQEKLREISNQLDPWDEKHQDRLRKQMQQSPKKAR